MVNRSFRKRMVIKSLWSVSILIFSVGTSTSQIQKKVNFSNKVSGLNEILMVKGEVVDEIGNPLSDVGVLYVERARQKKTDADGNFVMAMNSNETLEFSCVGFKTKTVKVSKQFLKIKLKRL